VDVTNERPLGTTITADASLTNAHRNRFTVCQAIVDIILTVYAYAGIVAGAEHEFFNAGTRKVTIQTSVGVTILSLGSKTTLPSNAAASPKTHPVDWLVLVFAEVSGQQHVRVGRWSTVIRSPTW
jgi:hypothetical protein